MKELAFNDSDVLKSRAQICSETGQRDECPSRLAIYRGRHFSALLKQHYSYLLEEAVEVAYRPAAQIETPTCFLFG
jgi:hypothetical protein